MAALEFTVGAIPFELFVWCVYAGIMIAGIMAVYNKRFLGNFVRKLIEEEAYTPYNAMTLEELGFEKNSILKYEIKRGVVFKSIVYEKDDEVVITDGSAAPVFHKELDFEKARFYIPYELRHRAGLKFDKKGTHVMLLVFSAIFFLALALLAIYLSEPFLALVEEIFKNIE